MCPNSMEQEVGRDSALRSLSLSPSSELPLRCFEPWEKSQGQRHSLGQAHCPNYSVTTSPHSGLNSVFICVVGSRLGMPR